MALLREYAPYSLNMQSWDLPGAPQISRYVSPAVCHMIERVYRYSGRHIKRGCKNFVGSVTNIVKPVGNPGVKCLLRWDTG